MIYKNIPHITVEGIFDLAISNKFLYCIVEEKIDGAPLIVGKNEDNKLYVQTGRSDKIFNYYDNPFLEYTRNITQNTVRLNRALGYDKSIRFIMLRHENFFKSILCANDWMRYEMLSTYLMQTPVQQTTGFIPAYSIITYINNNSKSNTHEITTYTKKFVSVGYKFLRFSSKINLIETDRNIDYVLYPLADSEVHFLNDDKTVFELPHDVGILSDFLDKFNALDNLNIVSEGLIFKFYGQYGIESYKLTTKYFKNLRTQSRKK